MGLEPVKKDRLTSPWWNVRILPFNAQLQDADGPQLCKALTVHWAQYQELSIVSSTAPGIKCHFSSTNVPPDAYVIWLGTTAFQGTDSDAVVAYVDLVVVNPNYNKAAYNNDVALLRLSSPVTFTDTVRPICVAPSNVDLTQFKYCLATGFGVTNYTGQTNVAYNYCLLL